MTAEYLVQGRKEVLGIALGEHHGGRELEYVVVDPVHCPDHLELLLHPTQHMWSIARHQYIY